MNADRDGIKGQRMRIDDNERVSENDVMNDEWLCLPDRRSKDAIDVALIDWLDRSLIWYHSLCVFVCCENNALGGRWTKIYVGISRGWQQV